MARVFSPYLPFRQEEFDWTGESFEIHIMECDVISLNSKRALLGDSLVASLCAKFQGSSY